jgi:hypothetical protein
VFFSHDDHYCKIRTFEKVAVACAGVLEVDSLNFSVFKMAQEACAGPGSIYNKLTRFDAMLRPALLAVWRLAQAGNHLPVARIEIAFVGMYDDTPVFIHEQFEPDVRTDPPETVVKRAFYPHRGMVDSLEMVVMGERAEIVNTSLIKPVKADTYTGAAIKLVQIEIDAVSRVGGPIDVLCVDRNGHHWVQRKEECQDER